MLTESPATPQTPLELLLRAVERTVRAHREFNGVMLVDSIMHLNNAAQYMRTVQKPVGPVLTECLSSPFMTAPLFPYILLRSCRETISDAKEIAREPSQFTCAERDKFAGECEEVLEHIKATLEANKS